MSGNRLYEERLASGKTETLFIVFTIIFAVLALWQLSENKLNLWSALLVFFALFFLFYSINYRVLIIRLVPSYIELKFGVFRLSISLDDIESYRIDHLTFVQKYGGAGIHFMFVGGRYRAFFNFLEYPRVVIVLKRKKGPVREISFSTRCPDEIMGILDQALESPGAA
jgi:hypothetical protein